MWKRVSTLSNVVRALEELAESLHLLVLGTLAYDYACIHPLWLQDVNVYVRHGDHAYVKI